VGRIVFFVGVAVKEIPPLTLVTLRVGLAAALLWACAPLIGVSPPRSMGAAAALAVVGFGNNALPFALIAWGQTHLSSGLASILNAATPLFTVLAAHVLTREEKLSGLKLFGSLAGMAGVAWLVGPDLLLGGGTMRGLAELAVLAAALCYALSAIYARRIRSLGLQPIDVAAGQATAATLFLAPPSGPAVASVLAIAAFFLFPDPGRGRRDQCAARDAARPGELGAPRGVVSRRAAPDAPVPRLRAHRDRSCVHRRPPAPRPARRAR
jgi:drug/metabolite transporter (DMT)-like permease